MDVAPPACSPPPPSTRADSLPYSLQIFRENKFFRGMIRCDLRHLSFRPLDSQNRNLGLEFCLHGSPLRLFLFSLLFSEG
jgi:hypothetical protein